jgi:hypothetical protein
MTQPCDHEEVRSRSKGEITDAPQCPDILAALPLSFREEQDGPLLLKSPALTSPSSSGSLQLCTYHWFSQHEMCSLLREHGGTGTVVFIGDSLTRHAMQAMQMILRGDLQHGGLR